MSIEKVKIEIKTLGSAFQEDSFEYELARILRELAYKIEYGLKPSSIMDHNGNKVGSVEYIKE
jgi:hypothetical protein